MFSKRLLVLGLLVFGMASPAAFEDQFQKCDEGRFNIAAGQCVSESAD